MGRSFKTSIRAHMAALRHGKPAQQLRVVLIVGQDGAVGTAVFLTAMLRAAGDKVGIITAQFIEVAGERVQGSDQADVTGDPFRLQALLAQMRKAGCTFVLIQVPPELPAHQFAKVDPDMVIIRRCGDNVVDQTAVAAQLAMVQTLLAHNPEFVVYNRDDPAGEELSHLSGQDGVMSFGTHRRAECKMTAVQLHPKGSAVALNIDHSNAIELASRHTGKQAVYNMAAAAAAAYVLRLPIEAITEGCLATEVLTAHIQAIPVARPYQIIVDAAFTPGGIAETLEVVKHFAKNRLIVVYGAPLGTRPAWLPLIGELLATHADRIFITDGEFAKNQSSKQVREQVAQGAGALAGDAKTDDVAERQTAIEKAIGIARRGDIVLIVASTTRPYRQTGAERHPWSDVKTIEALFET